MQKISELEDETTENFQTRTQRKIKKKMNRASVNHETSSRVIIFM